MRYLITLLILSILSITAGAYAHFPNVGRGVVGASRLLQESVGLTPPPPGGIFIIGVRCSQIPLYPIETDYVFPSNQVIVITEVFLEDDEVLTLYEETRQVEYKFYGPHWVGDRIFLPNDNPVGRITSPNCNYGTVTYRFASGYYWGVE